MAQIKINQQNEEQNDQLIKPKINLKAAIRLAEKEEQELIHKISKFHNQNFIRPILNYQQQKTQLQKYLDISSEDRNKKVLKSIKAELSYLKCFQIRSQEENTPKQLVAIMKRDLDMFTAVIAKFVHPKLWPKGSILESVARQRDKIRVLLRGQVAVFEPINYKSYKNCLKLYQADKARNQLMAAVLGFVCETIHYDNESTVSDVFSKFNPEQFQAQDWQDFHNDQKTLQIETARNLLKKMNIITLSTPHRLSYHLKSQGELICSEFHPFIIEQEAVYTHTAICLTECYVMELEYEVYKQAISHLNSDDEKKYIEILLRKFEMMQYFDAKQYVKRQFMIDKKKEEAQLKSKMIEEGQQLNQFQKQFMMNQGRQIEKDVESQSDQQNLKKKGKEEPDLQCYPISFDSDLYLIIEGEVTLQIDVIEQTRLSTLEHASKVRQRKPRSILKLYQGDIFGFEEIGKTKEYNLTYFVQKSSKILLMADEIYIRHFSQIQGFRQSLKGLQNKRNHLLQQIIKNLQKTINQQQLKKYKSVSLLQRTRFNQTPTQQPKNGQYVSLLPSNLVPPRQLQYLGSKQYEKQQKKLRENVIKQKQSQGNNPSLQKLVKNGVNLKQSLPFVSSFKNTLSKNSKIVGNYMQVRDQKGALLRRRSIVDSAREQDDQSSNFFRKIGIINAEQRNNHNLNIIMKRKSKYKLDQFGEQEKELKRLKKIATSLPKMTNFFAKKEQVLYKNMHKLDYQKLYY